MSYTAMSKMLGLSFRGGAIDASSPPLVAHANGLAHKEHFLRDRRLCCLNRLYSILYDFVPFYCTFKVVVPFMNGMFDIDTVSPACVKQYQYRSNDVHIHTSARVDDISTFMLFV